MADKQNPPPATTLENFCKLCEVLDLYVPDATKELLDHGHFEEASILVQLIARFHTQLSSASKIRSLQEFSKQLSDRNNDD